MEKSPSNPVLRRWVLPIAAVALGVVIALSVLPFVPGLPLLALTFAWIANVAPGVGEGLLVFKDFAPTLMLLLVGATVQSLRHRSRALFAGFVVSELVSFIFGFGLLYLAVWTLTNPGAVLPMTLAALVYILSAVQLVAGVLGLFLLLLMVLPSEGRTPRRIETESRATAGPASLATAER